MAKTLLNLGEQLGATALGIALMTSASAAVARASLGVSGNTPRGDANYTILATDRFVGTNAALTAGRVWTLPAANTVSAADPILVTDFFGGVTSTNTITIPGNGTDTVNGAASVVINQAFGGYLLWSDGATKWIALNLGATVSAGVDSNVTGSVSGLFAWAGGASATGNLSFREAALSTSGGVYKTFYNGVLAINTATTGANALDTGTIAASTWYSKWIIGKSDGTVAGLISLPLTTTGNTTSGSAVVTSLSSTTALSVGMPIFSVNFPAGTVIKSVDSSSQVTMSRNASATTTGVSIVFVTYPTMPSGYTYRARVGWIRTDGTGNKYPLSYQQAGRFWTYVTTASANVTALPIMASGTLGTYPTPTWAAVAVGNYVGPTACAIELQMTGGSSLLAVAPNSNYGAYTSTTNPPPLIIQNGPSAYSGARGIIRPETSNIYAVSQSACQLQCVGFEDNI